MTPVKTSTMTSEYSGVVPISPGSPVSDPDTSPEKDGPDGPGKKKKSFQPLKSLKRFFSAGKKKGKTKEEDVTSVGIKSTSCDVLETHKEEASQLASKNMSLSADSVFSGDKPRDANIDFTRSMEVLPQRNFKDELARKLQRRRGDDDDGLPASPPGHTTTADILMENSLKDSSMSMDSEHSLMSMDSSEAELEDDFFGRMATNVSRRPQSPGDGPVDLDVITSTSSLNMTAAKHKIAIKPKTKRSSAGPVSNRRKTASSPKPAGAMMVMPQLREESPPKSPTKKDAVVTEDGDTSHEKIDSTDEEIEADTTDRSEDKDDDKTDRSDDPQNTSTQEMTMDISDKTGVDSEDEAEEIKEDKPKMVLLRKKSSPREEKAERPSSGVIMRRDRDSTHDPSKRQTIAVSTAEEVTPFGVRKLNQRSSLILDGKKWEELDKPKDKSPDEPEEQPRNEFASVFAKFQRKASDKKVVLDQTADKLEGKNQGSAVFKSDKKESATVKNTTKVLNKVTSPVTSPTKSSPEKTQTNIIKSVDVPSAKSVSYSVSKTTSNTNKKEAITKTVVIQKSNTIKDSEDSKSVRLREKKDGSSSQDKTEVGLNSGKRGSDTKRDSTGKRASDTKPDSSGKRGSDTKRDSGDSKRASDSKGDIDSTNDIGSKKSSLKSDSTPKSHVIQKSSKFGAQQSDVSTPNDTKKDSQLSKTKSGGQRKETEKQTETKSDKSNENKQYKPPTKSLKIVELEKKEDTKNSSKLNEPVSSHKRDSPRPTNRLRSQTLPEQAVKKQTPLPVAESPQLKRAISEEGGVNKENKIPTPQASSSSSASSSNDGSPKKSVGLVRPAGSGRPEPHKLNKTIPEASSSQPSWVALAKKKRDGWSQDEDGKNDGANRDKEDGKGGNRASVLDLMKRFQ